MRHGVVAGPDVVDADQVPPRDVDADGDDGDVQRRDQGDLGRLEVARDGEDGVDAAAQQAAVEQQAAAVAGGARR